MRIDSSTPGTCHPVEKAVGKRVKDKLIFCIVSIAAYMLYIYVIAPFIGDASIDRNREYTAHDMVGVQIFVVDVFSRIILVSVTFIISMVMSWKRYHSLCPPFVSLALFFGLLYAIEERDSYCSFPSIQRFEYPTGELLAKGKIVKGTSGSSKWKSYYRSGSLQTEEAYDYIGNLNSYKAYYENGNVKTIGCFYNFNTPNGIWEFYSETNKLIEKRVYKEGALVSSTRCKLKSGSTPEEVERYRCATTGKSIEESVVSSDKIAEVFGDLDSDGVDEKVTVLSEGQDASGFGRERVLYVYKQTNNKWDVWCKSTQAILSDESGGMMGDPFMSVTIKQGCIKTEHYGGSRLRWGYKHRYRFQNGKCELINVTSERSEPMEFNESVDYNLSTEEVIYTYKSDKRNTRKVFTHHLEETPTIENIGMGENIIEVPDENVSFTF